MSESDTGNGEEPNDDNGDEYGNTLDVELGGEEGEGLDDLDASAAETTELRDDGDDGRDGDNTGSGSDVTGGVSGSGEDTSSDASSRSAATGAHTDRDIPHRVRSESPKNERESINLYVAPDEKKRLNDLKQLANDEFDETVYQIDVYLAALRSSMYDENAFLTELQDMGYGYFG